MEDDNMQVHNCNTQRGYPLFYKREVEDNGHRINGCNPGVEMYEGDKIILPGINGHFIINEVERRDAKGNFTNEEDKKDSFFSALCEYIKPIE